MTYSGVHAAIKRTHAWFESNSGWAEPTRDTLQEWLDDDVCRCADECWVAVDGVCEHGLASWWLVLHAMGEHPELRGPARRSLLDHAPNFRDLGGIVASDGRVLRTGMVFRSGVMDLLDDGDLSRLRAIGVRTVVDLRSSDEVVQRPNRLPEAVVTHHVPVHDVSAAPRSIIERIAAGDSQGLGAPMLINGNAAFATTHRAVFGEVLDIVTDPDHWPVVVHCTAGKDRTGFTIAALLWALDVDQNAVIGDYLESNTALDARHAMILNDMEARGLDPRMLREMLTCAPEYLDAGYDAAVAEYGSIDAWLTDGLGIDAVTRSRWREHLLEAPDPNAKEELCHSI